MMKTVNTNTIRSEFFAGEIDYLSAIEELEKFGYNSRDAEELVSEWSEEKIKNS